MPLKPAIAFIFVTVVIDVLAMGVVIPVLPKLVEAFEGGNTALAAETYGLFGTAWGLMQFLFMPIVGSLSDRFGRRPVILISCFGLGLDCFLMQLAHVVLPSVTVLYMSYRYGWSELQVGLVLAGVGACSMVVQGLMVKPVVARVGERRAMALGLTFGVLGFLCYGIAGTGAL